MRAHGFQATVHDVEDVTPYRQKAGVPTALAGCHTALVAGYAVEGHVPGDLVRQMLRERPDVVGLAVPGMPLGSPGMEGPYKEPYDVLAIEKNGMTSIFATR
jgi:hypothetical protein